MEGYNIGKEMAVVLSRLDNLEALMEQVYTIVDHNIKTKTLEEPKPPKK